MIPPEGNELVHRTNEGAHPGETREDHILARPRRRFFFAIGFPDFVLRSEDDGESDELRLDELRQEVSAHRDATSKYADRRVDANFGNSRPL